MDGSNIPRRENTIRITIRNPSRLSLPISYSAITGLIQKIFKYLARSRKSTSLQNIRLLGVVFLDDKRIKRLNLKYLRANRPTDILAFPYSKDTADLVISLETAKRNAKIYNTSMKKEIMLYIIHGLLHLCGYDDTTQNARKKMFKKQEEIFNLILLKNVKP